MNENPDFWNTIATVIPVLALTYATALKRGDWHKLKASARRWTAFYGAGLVVLLIWVESVALDHLRDRTSSAADENVAYIVVGWAAAQVLAVPVAPLIIIAIHDLHPIVLRAKRSLRRTSRKVAVVRKQYSQELAMIERQVSERKIEGAELVLRTPGLVFTASGEIREGYIERISAWQSARAFQAEANDVVQGIENELQIVEKQLKKAKKSLAKVVRAQTKKAAMRTDLHR